jgi:hypothetical protein
MLAVTVFSLSAFVVFAAMEGAHILLHRALDRTED